MERRRRAGIVTVAIEVGCTVLLLEQAFAEGVEAWGMLPRARTRISDYVWAGVALVMAAVLIWRLVVSTAALVVNPSEQQLLSWLVVALLSVVAGLWLVGGAWRRTIWGAPAGGVREHRERRLANGTGRETDEQ